MRSYKRSDSIADLIRKEIATSLTTEALDSRFFYVTLTRSTMAPDLSFIRIFFVIFDDKIDKEVMSIALNKAKGFFKAIIAKNLKLRKIPEIEFKYDEAGKKDDSLIELLNNL